MPIELIALTLAVAAFVGSHVLMSHTLRASLLAALGEAGFQTCYALIAAGLLLLIVFVYHFAPHGPLVWSANNPALQAALIPVNYFAVVLFVASLDSNPALVGANLNGLSTRTPSGAFRVTRHPMMFAIAIWSVGQIALIPSARNLISCGGIVVLAVAGSWLQDQKKLAQAPREWGMWTNRTGFWPDLRRVGELGAFWLYAAIPWLAATWLQVRLSYVLAGPWYFFPELPY